jgi:triosephosphate isomerase
MADKFVIANWKQNKNRKEVEEWLGEFEKLIEQDLKGVKVIVSPAFVHLHLFTDIVNRVKNFFAAGQDVSAFEEGRHTGLVGASQLRSYADYCIVGHSETKAAPEEAMKKGVLCLENGITPIVCFVDSENPPQAENVILAWEDPGNISTDKGYRAADPDTIKNTINRIKSKLAKDVPVLYGGSVNRQNASELSNISELDGVLVGGASLDPQHFYQIVKAFASLETRPHES